MKYLGVSARDLLWNPLINTLVTNDGDDKTFCRLHNSYNCYKYLCSVLVCSNIEQCSTVWFPFIF